MGHTKATLLVFTSSVGVLACLGHEGFQQPELHVVSICSICYWDGW